VGIGSIARVQLFFTVEKPLFYRVEADESGGTAWNSIENWNSFEIGSDCRETNRSHEFAWPDPNRNKTEVVIGYQEKY
jgi:hypothetical protein